MQSHSEFQQTSHWYWQADSKIHMKIQISQNKFEKECMIPDFKTYYKAK